MYSGTTYLYIVLGSAGLVLLFPILFGLIFILLMYFRFKSNFIDNSESKNSTDSLLPLYLFRAHAARYVAVTGHSFDEIKSLYTVYIKKFAFINGVEQNYELNQVQYLINNNVNVEQTIREGKKEAHKKRLLILFFLFNISVVAGKISERDRLYLDEIYISLGISYFVYNKIRSSYIKQKQKNISDHINNISISNYKLQKAYKVLNLKKNANFKEVKNAYRKLAKRYHPDVYKVHDTQSMKSAEKKFNEITSAYEIINKYIKN